MFIHVSTKLFLIRTFDVETTSSWVKIKPPTLTSWKSTGFSRLGTPNPPIPHPSPQRILGFGFFGIEWWLITKVPENFSKSSSLQSNSGSARGSASIPILRPTNDGFWKGNFFFKSVTWRFRPFGLRIPLLFTTMGVTNRRLNGREVNCRWWIDWINFSLAEALEDDPPGIPWWVHSFESRGWLSEKHPWDMAAMPPKIDYICGFPIRRSDRFNRAKIRDDQLVRWWTNKGLWFTNCWLCPECCHLSKGLCLPSISCKHFKHMKRPGVVCLLVTGLTLGGFNCTS